MSGNLVAPLLTFGKKKAQYKASLAAYDEKRFAYEQKVLEVFREVNDAVITYQKKDEHRNFNSIFLKQLKSM